jgi:hypothetical protein
MDRRENAMKFNKTQRIILRIFGVLAFILFIVILGQIMNYHKGSFLSPVLALAASGGCFIGAASKD